MASNSVPTETRPGAIAPAWHTAIVLLAQFGISLVGGVSRNPLFLGSGRRIAGYFLIIAFEWILLAFIWYGVRRRGFRLTDLIGGSWARPLAILRDVGLAAGFLIVSGDYPEWRWSCAQSHSRSGNPRLLPRNPSETVAFILVGPYRRIL